MFFESARPSTNSVVDATCGIFIHKMVCGERVIHKRARHVATTREDREAETLMAPKEPFG